MYIESLQGSRVVLTLILLSRLENERFTERTESPETLFPTTYVKRSPVSLLEQILNNRRRFGLKRQVGKTFILLTVRFMWYMIFSRPAGGIYFSLNSLLCELHFFFFLLLSKFHAPLKWTTKSNFILSQDLHFYQIKWYKEMIILVFFAMYIV